MQKNWIGRSRRPAGPLRARSEDHAERRERAGDFHHAAGHAVRREVHGDRAGPSAGAGGGGEESDARGVHRRVQAHAAPRRPRSTPPRSWASTPASARCIRSIRHWKLPVYVANFILMDYGTGAIFGCPAHDQRDLDFVNKYGLGNTPVVCPPGQDPTTFVITDTAYDGDGRMINSRFLDGMTIEQAKEEVAKRLENADARQRAGRRSARSISACATGASRGSATGAARSRSSIARPAASCRCRRRTCRCKLPEDVTFDRPGNPLDRHPTWKNVACPQCGRPARRETDTMDTFVDSSWYFARFTDPWIDDRADRPQGGRRLAAGRSVHRRHRARDPASALLALLHPRDEGDRPCRPRRAVRRPVHPGHGGARDLSQDGRRMGDAGRGQDRRRGRRAHARRSPTTGEPIEIGAIEKMSKSKKNTIDPDDIMATYGADVARWFMLSDSPPERDVEWTERGVQGAWRFVQRLWRLVGEAAEIAQDRAGRAARPHSASRRWRCARPRTARSPRCRTRSRSCTSTSPSRTSTSSPTRWARPSPNRPRPRISPGRCARPPTSWCGCSTR